MPITLYTADQSQRLRLNDYQVNTATSLQLIGYGYVNETNPSGQILNQNFVALLQNFSCGAAPLNPIAGQIWYDNSSTTLQLFNEEWENVVLASEVLSSEMIATEFYTEDQITDLDFLTGNEVASYSYEAQVSTHQYVTSASLTGFSYANSSFLSTTISGFLSNYIANDQLYNLITSSQLSSDGYLDLAALNSLNLATASMLTGYLSANQEITLSGAISGSGSTLIPTTLVNSGVDVGSYNSVVVDEAGFITNGLSITLSEFESILGFDVILPSSFDFNSAGYQKFPSGLIVQWITGAIDPADNTSPEQTLPWAMTFPTAFLGATVSTNIQSNSSDAEFWYQISLEYTSTSQVVVQRQNDSIDNNVTSTPFIIGFGY